MINLRKGIQILINNLTYIGKSVNIVNNKIIIDGVDVTDQFKNDKEINITINGDLDSLHVDACNKVLITGNCNNVKTTSADVYCGNIENNVNTISGDISCNHVKGNVSTTSGDINAKEIQGNCKTISGDISKNFK